ncbi:MAG: right-handed parallel beta-helix repeat-containing protein [Planctomycetota bacterium]|nr:right-handed parallel beta-helix repeat-containing protein [Planctomycetota bacterium]
MRGAITILLLALAGLPARATEYAVAPGGLDGNSGLPDSPWRTLQKAADTLNAGDTVVVADGSYDGFVARNSGSSGSPIVFRAANPGGALIDAPSGDAVGEELDHHVAIRGKSYIVVDGFEVAGAPKAGILVRSLTDTTGTDTRGVVVRNCVVHGNGTSASAGHDGIRAVLAREFAADGNEVYGNAAHGIAVLGGADGPALRRNKVHENGLDGIRLDGNLSLGGDGTISFWLVERNEVYGHPGGDALGLDGAAQGIAQNNLLYRNGQRGIHLYVQNGAAASASNLVVNNTVYNPSASGAALRLADGANNNVAFNNLLYTTFGTGISAGAVSGFSHDYNTFTNISGGAQAAHEFLNPPGAVFTDTAADDYTLKAGSPALNSGALEFSGTGAPGEDLQGTTRPFGAGIDRGAFEQGPPPDTSPPGVTILFPTLGTKYTTVAETTALSGAANDDRGVALVTWSNDAGGSGFALGTVSWSVPNVALALGPNVITVMALDAAGNTGSDTLTVTRLPPPNQPPVLGPGRLPPPIRCSCRPAATCSSRPAIPTAGPSR